MTCRQIVSQIRRREVSFRVCCKTVRLAAQQKWRTGMIDQDVVNFIDDRY